MDTSSESAESGVVSLMPLHSTSGDRLLTGQAWEETAPRSDRHDESRHDNPNAPPSLFMQILSLAEYFSNTKITPVHEESEHNLAFAEDDVNYHDMKREQLREELEEKQNVNKLSVWFELFFDLIFVAYLIELGYLLKRFPELEPEHRISRIAETFLLFLTGWLTWFHTNMLLTTFEVRGLFRMLTWLMTMFNIMLAAYTIRGSACANGDGCNTTEFAGGDFDAMVMLFLSRLCLFLINCACHRQVPASKHTMRIYLTFIAMELILMIIGIAADRDDDGGKLRTSIWIAAACLELVMYPASWFLIDPCKQMPLDTEHNVERNELWVIITIGEGVLSIVTAPHDSATEATEYFGTMVMAVMVILLLMQIYHEGQPESEVGLDLHACDHHIVWALIWNYAHLFITVGLFGMGVALKLVMTKASTPEKFTAEMAWLTTVSTSFALLCMNVARGCHKYSNFRVFGLQHGRTWLIWLHVLISIGIAPLALLIDVDKKDYYGGPTASPSNASTCGAKYKYTRNGSTPTFLLGIMLIPLCILYVVESLLSPSRYQWWQFFNAKVEEQFVKEAKQDESKFKRMAAGKGESEDQKDKATMLAQMLQETDLPQIKALYHWELIRRAHVPSKRSDIAEGLQKFMDLVHHAMENRRVRVMGGGGTAFKFDPRKQTRKISSEIAPADTDTSGRASARAQALKEHFSRRSRRSKKHFHGPNIMGMEASRSSTSAPPKVTFAPSRSASEPSSPSASGAHPSRSTGSGLVETPAARTWAGFVPTLEYTPAAVQLAVQAPAPSLPRSATGAAEPSPRHALRLKEESHV